MSKSKSSSKAAKPSGASVLSKVKDAAIVKPAQQAKAKSKELARVVAGKEEKKSKKSKKVREPTPGSSEDDDDSESSESSSSESEDEQPSKTAVNGKANGAHKASKADDSADSDSDGSSDEESSADETLVDAAKAKANSIAKPPADSDASDSDDDSAASSNDSSESDEDEKPAKKPAKIVASKANDDASGDSSGEGSSDESESSEDDSADEKEIAKPTVAKRKAEDVTETVAKKIKVNDSAAAQSSNLFVGSLSWNVDDAWLRETFEAFGEISRAQVMTDRATGRSKGFGYVEFVNAEDAARAHSEKQGVELDGRALNIDFANARPNNQDRQDNRRKSYGDQVSEPSDTLFLGNLSFDVGQEAVTEVFSPHGTVLGIRLPTDRETGQPKGFGYVTFASVDEATAALEAVQGSYIAGRPVRLDYSQPRPQNSDSPARGGRGGFGGRGGGGRGAGRGGRGGRGGFGGGFGGGRGGRGGAPRANTTNRGGFGDFAGSRVSFD